MLNDRLVEGLARLRSQEGFPVMKEALANGYLSDDLSLDEFLASGGTDGIRSQGRVRRATQQRAPGDRGAEKGCG